MENMKELVCNNFIRLVDASPFTKRELAKLIGVNENTLQRWKNKDSYPELPNIERLAMALNVSPLEFYKSGKEEKSKTLPMSATIKKLASIPDDIYDLAAKINDIHDPQWQNVRNALEVAIDRNEKKSNHS